MPLYGLPGEELEILQSELRSRAICDEIESLADWPGVRPEIWQHSSEASCRHPIYIRVVIRRSTFPGHVLTLHLIPRQITLATSFFDPGSH